MFNIDWASYLRSFGIFLIIFVVLFFGGVGILFAKDVFVGFINKIFNLINEIRKGGYRW